MWPDTMEAHQKPACAMMRQPTPSQMLGSESWGSDQPLGKEGFAPATEAAGGPLGDRHMEDHE